MTLRLKYERLSFCNQGARHIKRGIRQEKMYFTARPIVVTEASCKLSFNYNRAS